MTLKEAVKTVIQQNLSMKYHPIYFIKMTKNGEAENLKSVVSGLILDENLDYILEQQFQRYGGGIMLIENLVIENDFGLPGHVVEAAQRRVDKFVGTRKFYQSNRF